jgi:hypothetical protein
VTSRRPRWPDALPTLACFKMLRPSAMEAIMPYSMPLCTILTKWPAPFGPQRRYPWAAVSPVGRPGVGSRCRRRPVRSY